MRFNEEYIEAWESVALGSDSDFVVMRSEGSQKQRNEQLFGKIELKDGAIIHFRQIAEDEYMRGVENESI